jgi:hypothetical protein
MLIRLAILAVILSVAQTPVPVSRQASNNNRSTGNATQSKTNKGYSASDSPASVVQKTASDQPQDEAQTSHAHDDHESISVTEHTLTLPSERVAHKRTGFGLSSGWR